MHVAAKAGIGIAVGGGIGIALHAALRGPTVESVADTMMRQHDHDGSGSIELTPSGGLLTDERFRGGYQNPEGPATSTDSPFPYAGRLFEQADSDRNGAVDGAELLEAVSTFDENGNGRLGRFAWGTSEHEKLYRKVDNLEPKMIDYRAPTSNIGVTNY